MIPIVSERRRKRSRRFMDEKKEILDKVTSSMKDNPVAYLPFRIGDSNALLHTLLSVHLLHDLLKEDPSAVERIFSSRTVSFPQSITDTYLQANRKQWSSYEYGNSDESLYATEYVERKFKQYVKRNSK